MPGWSNSFGCAEPDHFCCVRGGLESLAIAGYEGYDEETAGEVTPEGCDRRLVYAVKEKKVGVCEVSFRIYISDDVP